MGAQIPVYNTSGVIQVDVKKYNFWIIWEKQNWPRTDVSIKIQWYICTMKYKSTISRNKIMPIALRGCNRRKS